MKIGNKEKVLLFILAIMIVTALVVILAIMPMQRANADLQAKIKETQEQKQTIVTKLGENNINLITAQKKLKELEKQKAAIDGFFVPYDEEKDDLLQIQKYIYENVLEGEGFSFDKVVLNDGIQVESVEGSENLKVLQFKVELNKDSSSLKKVTVKDFYKFKENIAKIKSAVIFEEGLTYTKTSEINEECEINTAWTSIAIYMYQAPVEKPDVEIEK